MAGRIMYAANPHSIGFISGCLGSRLLLTETVRIKQNRAENAKPSQFSRVFSEVPGSLRRDKGIQQALIVRFTVFLQTSLRRRLFFAGRP